MGTSHSPRPHIYWTLVLEKQQYRGSPCAGETVVWQPPRLMMTGVELEKAERRGPHPSPGKGRANTRKDSDLPGLSRALSRGVQLGQWQGLPERPISLSL